MKLTRTILIGTALSLVLTACGGIAELADAGLEEDFSPQPMASENAEAVLVVGGDAYTWEYNEWTICSVDGVFPAQASFQTGESTQSSDWVQFIDRDDGGINFSAYIAGEEYHGTGSGEADSITSTGFTYVGTMGYNGEDLETSLEVTC